MVIVGYDNIIEHSAGWAAGRQSDMGIKGGRSNQQRQAHGGHATVQGFGRLRKARISACGVRRSDGEGRSIRVIGVASPSFRDSMIGTDVLAGQCTDWGV